MSMDRETRSFSPLRVNREVLVALLCCLIAICRSVESRSISELLSDLELEDNSQFLPQKMASAGDSDDEYDDMAAISDDLLSKRSPWAPYEVNVDNLRQNLLRSKMFNSREKHMLPNYRGGTGFAEHVSELSSGDAFADGYMAGWLSARKQFLGDVQHDVDGARETGTDLMAVLRKLEKRVEPNNEKLIRMRSTSSIHPVYLGMGQETANAALSTFASLLAEEEKRKNSDLPSNPVRFIGKRYLTDE